MSTLSLSTSTCDFSSLLLDGPLFPSFGQTSPSLVFVFLSSCECNIHHFRRPNSVCALPYVSKSNPVLQSRVFLGDTVRPDVVYQYDTGDVSPEVRDCRG